MKIVFFILLLLNSLNLFAQDSLKIYFIGSFLHSEKYLITYEGNLLKKYCVKSYFGDTLKIERPLKYKSMEFLPIKIFKKYLGFYKDTEISILNYPDKKYLLIYRDKRMRNRYSLNYYWFDNPFEIPIGSHLGGIFY